MTLDQFVAKVPKKGWVITSNGAMRQFKKSGLTYCPLTAAANNRNGLFNTQESAKKLGLTEKQRGAIIRAADNLIGIEDFNPRLRKKLLNHCGLVELS